MKNAVDNPFEFPAMSNRPLISVSFDRFFAVAVAVLLSLHGFGYVVSIF